ncbi:hypothetical protein GB937_007657 [Aspergillus fischeri]|nr:hypothetical protein GB937_007657 [Aspergillus fischeri]
MAPSRRAIQTESDGFAFIQKQLPGFILQSTYYQEKASDQCIRELLGPKDEQLAAFEEHISSRESADLPQIQPSLSSLQWVIVYNPIKLLAETDHHLQSSTKVTTLTDHRGRPAEARVNTTSGLPASVTFDPRNDKGHSGKI